MLRFRFEDGTEQFRLDVAQNPKDTEESIWCFLCESQLYGVDEARQRFLEFGRDRRPVMQGAYNMFKDDGGPEKKNPDEAKVHIVAACQSPYGERLFLSNTSVRSVILKQPKSLTSLPFQV